MKFVNQVQNMFKYIWEGSSRIFGPDDNTYPETGVQPFTGDPYDKQKEQFNEI